MAKVYRLQADRDSLESKSKTGFGLGFDGYFVLADNEEEAKQKLVEAVRKHTFKQTLADAKYRGSYSHEEQKIADDVIAESSISPEIIDADLTVIDITPMAYLFVRQGRSNWKDWNITEEDALASNNR